MNNRRLEKVGLVSGAVWSDLDQDGDADLVLACEWGPVRIFRNEKGVLAEATSPLGLAPYRGWWNGVTTADFDGDGRMDIAASNWGRNSKYERCGVPSLRLLWGDVDGDSRTECVEAYQQQNSLWPLQPFHVAAAGLPLLRERISNYEQYARSTVAQIYPVPFQFQADVTTLDSMVFLNRGNRFDAVPLPSEAQFAPGFGLCSADFDGDGHDDLFLSQGFFATESETSRYDAGRGLLLHGDGRGAFVSVLGQQSGIHVYGEQRGAAVSDFDHDGRPDLLVTQNGAASVLLRNRAGRPGLRVRLIGPPQNPDAIGAVLRLRFANQLGSAREIHSNDGYWSQNGNVRVLTSPSVPTHLIVRWPGGKNTTNEIPPSAQEIAVDHRGTVRPFR
jgi:hypothetical protein